MGGPSFHHSLIWGRMSATSAPETFLEVWNGADMDVIYIPQKFTVLIWNMDILNLVCDLYYRSMY